MKTKLLFILISGLFFINLSADAQQMHYGKMKPISKQEHEQRIKKFDEMIAKRLNLTDEQKTKIAKDKKKNQKELQKIFNEMKKEQREIRNVYLTGIPKYQADIRTSASKAKLALLAQKAKAIREENRKNFESVLTPEQKIEFEKIMQEMREKKHKGTKIFKIIIK